jgi:replicative DNA helicase
MALPHPEATRTTRTVKNTAVAYGKTAQDSAEEEIIAQCLYEPKAIARIAADITPEMFGRAERRKVYQCLLEMWQAGEDIEIMTVAERLHSKFSASIDKAAIAFVALTAKVSSSTSIETHALILKERYLMSELAKYSLEVKARTENGHDPLETANWAQTEVMRITSGLNREQPRRIGSVLVKLQERIDEMLAGKRKTWGISTGFPDLDRYIMGFQAQEYVLIAGRPSSGKTSFLLSTALSQARSGHRVGILSIEQGEMDMVVRMLSSQSRINNQQIKRAELNLVEQRQVVQAIPEIARLPITIDFSSELRTTEMIAKCRQLVSQFGVEIIYADYLQLVRDDSPSREEQISEISRAFKATAKQLNIPIIALSQLNRKAEEREDRRPSIADLRGSGSLEQDADLVLLLWNPSAADPPIATFSDGSSTKNRAAVIIGKQREGIAGQNLAVILGFRKDQTRFYDQKEDQDESEASLF